MCKQILLCVCVSVCQFIQDLVLSWPLDLCQYWNLPPVGWGWNCPIRALSPNWLLLQSVVYVSSSPSLPWPNHVTLPQPLYTRCRGLHVIPSESCPPSYCDRANPIMYADHPFSFSACYEPPSAPIPTKLKSNEPVSTSYLAGGAVGQAGFVVGRQVEISGTGTPVRTTWRQQTQMAAPSVSHLALMLGNCGQGERKHPHHQVNEAT